MTRSICLAVYNGAQYLQKQLDSVIVQLDDNDEIIVVDDCSNDKTIEIIEMYRDPRIKVYKNPRNLGHVKSFERAISLANNELIYLCDQDDVWIKNRFSLFEDILNEKSNILLVSSNSYFIDSSEKEMVTNMHSLKQEDSFNYRKNIKNIFRGTIGYYGCAMAFKKDLRKIILPIPQYVESHDLWIAMAANLLKVNFHLGQPTFYRRIHNNNASLKNRALIKKIYSRIIFLKSYREIVNRIKNDRK